MALSIRLVSAVMSKDRSPRTNAPVSGPTTNSMPNFSAAVVVRATASATTPSTSITVRVGSGSAPCNRDSMIRSATRSLSRRDSLIRRRANACTASASPAAWSTASANNEMADTGVFNSCDTLARKSRRTSSNRSASVPSCAVTRTILGDPLGRGIGCSSAWT